MQKTLDVLMVVALFIIAVIVLAFAFTGACLVGSSQPVYQCRENVAGQIVYKTVSLVI